MFGSQDHCFMQNNCKDQGCQQHPTLAVNVLHPWHMHSRVGSGVRSSAALQQKHVCMSIGWRIHSQHGKRAGRRSPNLCLLDALYVCRCFQSQCRLPAVPKKTGPTPGQLQPALQCCNVNCRLSGMLACLCGCLVASAHSVLLWLLPTSLL